MRSILAKTERMTEIMFKNIQKSVKKEEKDDSEGVNRF